MSRRSQTLRAVWVTWTLAIATFATYQIFDDPSTITAQSVAALTAVIGLPPLFVGLYKWIRPTKVEK